MYCKIFTGQQVYDGMTDMSIACDNVFVTDGWICLYRGEQFMASFDMTTINGWVLIDGIADTPQTETSTNEEKLQLAVEPQTESTGSPIGDYRDGVGAWQTDCEDCELDGKADVCKICRVSNYEPQTDCGWK